MLCKKVLPLLSEFFDGVLDDDTSVQVSQHLGQCIRCRKEFNGLSALLTMLNSCANGVAVVNIDNGFGAGYLASIINQMKG